MKLLLFCTTFLFATSSTPILAALCLFAQYAVGLTLVDPDIGRTIVVIIWLIFEPVRLTAGFYGNLKENVSAFVFVDAEPL